MQHKSAKEIWDNIVLIYEGDEQVKRAKLQTLIIQYENLRIYNDESVANYFLRVDEVVNCMKNLVEEIREAIVVEKVLRSLSPKFESKVSAIEEKENLRILTMSQLHGILTDYEMRKGGPLDRREAAFKASGKRDYYEASHVPEEEEEESNFVRNLQRGSGRFRGKLPFKFFACGRVGHYAAKFPYKDKGKEPARWNKKQGENKKSYYTHEDSDGLSNSDEDERGNEYKLLMAFEDDDYMDAIDVDNLFEEITRLKRCIEEKNMIIDTLQFQIDEKEKHFEKLEGEIVALRKEIEKTKAINLKFVKGSETLDEIINVQHSLLNKTDDIIFGSNEEDMSQSFALVMQKEFEMSLLGELTYFLGLQIQQKEEGIFLSQTKYLKQILKKYGMENAKPVCTPMVTGCSLSANDESAAVHQTTYRSMIGSLLYLTGTRPDIMHAVGIVGRFQANPKETHLQAVKRIFKYLQGTQNYGLWYPRDTDLTLHAYTDADWAGSVDDRKSTSGGAFFMGSRLVSWFSKKQSSIALSTAEAEYVAAASCCTQLLCMMQTLQDFQITCTPPISILCDNTSAISISNNPVMHSKTKHIPIKYHFLREQVLEQKVKLEYVPSKEQVADILTKPLPRETFE
eukprot:PITA_08949